MSLQIKVLNLYERFLIRFTMHGTNTNLSQLLCIVVVYLTSIEIAVACIPSSPKCSQRKEEFCDHGIFIGVVNCENVGHCDATCNHLTVCEFYTFEENINQCMLYETCIDIIPCPNCISGNCTTRNDLNANSTRIAITPSRKRGHNP